MLRPPALMYVEISFVYENCRVWMYQRRVYQHWHAGQTEHHCSRTFRNLGNATLLGISVEGLKQFSPAAGLRYQEADGSVSGCDADRENASLAGQ